MVLRRAFRTAGCADCRKWILRSFASFEILPIRARPSLICPSTTHRQQTRPNTSFAHTGDQTGIVSAIKQEESQKVLEDVEVDVIAAENSSEAPDLPWYLKLNTHKNEPQPLSERQHIPELPEHSPPILQPLMQHVSVELGLDDLTLLDLRKLDPPPALGANLMMLLGTTRSEKHLHVSADRLCRWLRCNYKLRPDADGLLGRNELKLKLKRKNRRAKLMGNPTADNDDDGVRTGWVCVDVGVVDAVEVDHAGVSEPEFVGFGRRTDGVRIVVQMLTEEKREEINLEKLWGNILKGGLEAGLEMDGGESDSHFATTMLREPKVNYEVRKPSSILRGAFTQVRSIHTKTRRQATASHQKSLEYSLFYDDEAITWHPSVSKPLADDLSSYVARALSSQKYEALQTVIKPFVSKIPELQGSGWRAFLLRELRLHLEHMEPEATREHLGKRHDDYDSTPFLAGFYGLMSPFQSQAEFEARFWLHCFSRELGNLRGFTIRSLIAVYHEAQLSGVRISATAYKQIIFSILCPIKQTATNPKLTNQAFNSAMMFLKAMNDQGINILTEEMLVLLQEATNRPPPQINHEELHSSPGSLHFPSLPPSPIQRRLHLLTQKVDLPPFSEQSRLRLLDVHASQHQWREFWDVWRMAARYGQPSSGDMYRFMFEKVAQTKNQSACCTTLRTWIPEMERESTPVEITWELVGAIMRCVQVADPDVLTTYYNTPDANGEWVALWQKCVLKLEELAMRQEEMDARETRPLLNAANGE